MGTGTDGTMASMWNEWAVLDTSGIDAQKVSPLTTGGPPGASGSAVPWQWAEG